MRFVARVLVLGLATSVLGAADARAPDLTNSSTALSGVSASTVSGSQGPLSQTRSVNDEHQTFASGALNASSAAPPEESSRDFWLLSGVCVGLVAYQLHRKHRLLRPHPLPLNSEPLL